MLSCLPYNVRQHHVPGEIRVGSPHSQEQQGPYPPASRNQAAGVGNVSFPGAPGPTASKPLPGPEAPRSQAELLRKDWLKARSGLVSPQSTSAPSRGPGGVHPALLLGGCPQCERDPGLLPQAVNFCPRMTTPFCAGLYSPTLVPSLSSRCFRHPLSCLGDMRRKTQNRKAPATALRAQMFTHERPRTGPALPCAAARFSGCSAVRASLP